MFHRPWGFRASRVLAHCYFCFEFDGTRILGWFEHGPVGQALDLFGGLLRDAYPLDDVHGGDLGFACASV